MLDSYSLLLQVLHTKTGNAGVFNWGGWSYPELDKMIDQAGVTLDREKRLDLQIKALKLAKDQVLMIPLHQQPMVWATTADVKEMPQFPDNKPRLWYVRK
jgi:peptide/nickel transport system substrate-binding protein